jgi:hypothetical protein
MPQNIYAFETRNVNFLEPYMEKARSLGFNFTVTDNAHLQNNKFFNQFIAVYKHYSVNTPEFEIACFARYFAIASILKNDDPFILTDTDVFITRSFQSLKDFDFKGTFVGSEGFDKAGNSEGQVSPHCTIWNKSLLFDFLDFVMNTYKKNAEDDFLGEYYQSQQAKLGQTTVSDMNLIYFWIKENDIPFINSNSAKFEFGIDHNISVTRCADDEFKAFADRKLLKIRGDKITCFLKSGREMDMALLHFQGEYKAILKRFYLGRYAKFVYFSLRNDYRRRRREKS